jgi:rhodanese-related sulfurtransferase
VKEISFFGSTIVKETLVILLAGIVLGGFINQKLIRASINGELFNQIGKKQMADLKAKTAQIPFIELKEAKKLFDQGAAIFVDARSVGDYEEAHIKGARGLSLISLIENPYLAEKILPEKTDLYVVYCSGGGCDLSVELAEELLSRGYSKIEIMGDGYPGWFKAGYPVESSK